MKALVRGLTWPVIALLVIGSNHLAAEMLRPSLKDLIGPGVVMPIYLVAGGWAAYGTIRAGGTFIHGLVAGAIAGVLPLVLQIVGFGLILGRDADASLTSGLFGLAAIFWGGALGAGIAVSRGDPRADGVTH